MPKYQLYQMLQVLQLCACRNLKPECGDEFSAHICRRSNMTACRNSPNNNVKISLSDPVKASQLYRDSVSSSLVPYLDSPRTSGGTRPAVPHAFID